MQVGKSPNEHPEHGKSLVLVPKIHCGKNVTHPSQSAAEVERVLKTNNLYSLIKTKTDVLNYCHRHLTSQ